jgi:hypothetical protein
MQKIRFANSVFRDWRNKARRVDAPDAASGLPKSRLLTDMCVRLKGNECAAAVLRTMPGRAASATRTNHPLITQMVCGNHGNLIVNAKNACLGGLVVFARGANGMQICSWRMDQARRATYMHSMHQASLQHVQKKRKAKYSFLVNNHKEMLQILCAKIVTESVAASAKKEKGYKDFSHSVWDLDVGSPKLRCTECVAGPRKRGF